MRGFPSTCSVSVKQAPCSKFYIVPIKNWSFLCIPFTVKNFLAIFIFNAPIVHGMYQFVKMGLFLIKKPMVYFIRRTFAESRLPTKKMKCFLSNITGCKQLIGIDSLLRSVLYLGIYTYLIQNDKFLWVRLNFWCFTPRQWRYKADQL